MEEKDSLRDLEFKWTPDALENNLQSSKVSSIEVLLLEIVDRFESISGLVACQVNDSQFIRAGAFRISYENTAENQNKGRPEKAVFDESKEQTVTFI